MADNPITPTVDTDEWRRIAAEVLAIESEAVLGVERSLGDSFLSAVRLLRDARGKVICSGIGKSGHIARKIAATFSSTGTPALFVHPTEAGHGDLGTVGDGDIALLLSYSGENREIMELIPALRRLQIPLLAMVGAPTSTLAVSADICLSVAVMREACPHNLAPTASTTAMLAFGDALAMTLLRARGFSAEDFARTHPAGSLGKRLLLRVADVMRVGDAVPLVPVRMDFSDALLEMTGKRMGMTLVSDDAGRLLGIFTDGDLRRAINTAGDMRRLKIADVMTPNPRTVPQELLAADALRLMRENSLNHLAVVGDNDQTLVGALSFHDLLRHKVF